MTSARFGAASLALLLAQPVGAQAEAISSETSPTQPVATLDQAIAQTLSGNPDLLAQRARTRGADNRLPAARAAYGPQLSMTASAAYQRDRQELLPNRFVRAQGWSTTTQLILSQPVFTFGRNRSAEQIARAEIEFAHGQQRLAENQIVLDAISAYVAVQRDATLVVVARSNLDLLDRQYGASAERFRVREITIADLQQVETRQSLARAQLLQAQGELGASRSEFLRVIGRLPADVLEPARVPALTAASLDAAYAMADRDSPLLGVAHAREKISRGGVEAARAEMGPRVDLRGTAQHGAVTPYTDDLRLTTVRGEVQFQMPLVDSGLRRSRLAEAKEANDADWRLIDSAQREVRQSIATNWERFTASTRALVDYGQAADAAQRAYDGALLQEKAGFRTTLDVLDLARDLLTVRTNLVTAQASADVARAGLLATLGLLSDGDPAQTDAHFDRVKRRGDIPLLTPALSELDAITVRNTSRNRATRDDALNIRHDSVVGGGSPDRR